MPDIDTRMKEYYEFPTRYVLPRRTYTILRIDGKNFHAYTKQADKPFDESLQIAFEATSLQLCREMQGAQLAYTQSDEISILLTDFAGLDTEAWLGGVVQKMASVAASMATAWFNTYYTHPEKTPARFDARVFTIPSHVEVYNYFVWRQQDATRNAINMVCDAEFSHREVHGLSSDERQEKLFQERGINFNDFPTRSKRGAVVERKRKFEKKRFFHKGEQQWMETPEPVEYRYWETNLEPPIFTRSTFLNHPDRIPYIEQGPETEEKSQEGSMQ